jgi:hypothetical protein
MPVGNDNFSNFLEIALSSSETAHIEICPSAPASYNSKAKRCVGEKII